jgi:hypothetical protein
MQRVHKGRELDARAIKAPIFKDSEMSNSFIVQSKQASCTKCIPLTTGYTEHGVQVEMVVLRLQGLSAFR